MELPYTTWASWGVVDVECLDKINAELWPYRLAAIGPVSNPPWIVDVTEIYYLEELHPTGQRKMIRTSGQNLADMCKAALRIIAVRNRGR